MLVLAIVLSIVFAASMTWLSVLVSVVIVVSLAGLVAWRDAPLWLRNLVILPTFLYAGAVSLYSGQDAGAAVLYLITGVLLTGLLASARLTAAYLAGATAIVGLGSWAVTSGTVLMPAPEQVLSPPIMLVGNAGTLVAVGILIITSLSSLMGRLRRALAERESAVRELERHSEEREVSFEQLQESHVSLQAAQSNLIRAGKLELLGQLAGGIAHDMNNALTVILGEVGILEVTAPEQAEAITDAVEHASTLTRQLLAIGRREVVQPRTIDLGEAVRRAAAMLQRTLPSSIDLQLRLADGVLVHADPHQIQQLILNLGTNGAHALPSGGTLRIYVQRVGDQARIEVADEGVGMDPEILAHVFEPFFTTKPAGVGTGLGLPSVRAVVETLSGQITCESQLGVGTRFVIDLPIRGEPADLSASASEHEAALPRLDGRRVLVVDDEVRVRAMVTATLQAAGATVIDVGHVDAAIAVAEHTPEAFDLLWTDVVMPGGGGRRLVAHFRDHSPTTEIVVSTGYSDDELLTRELARGRHRLLPKPFSREELLRVATALLERPRTAPQIKTSVGPSQP